MNGPWSSAGPGVTGNGATAGGVPLAPIPLAAGRPAPRNARGPRMSESRRKWVFRKLSPEGSLMIRCKTYLSLAACVMAVPSAVAQQPGQGPQNQPRPTGVEDQTGAGAGRFSRYSFEFSAKRASSGNAGRKESRSGARRRFLGRHVGRRRCHPCHQRRGREIRTGIRRSDSGVSGFLEWFLGGSLGRFRLENQNPKTKIRKGSRRFVIFGDEKAEQEATEKTEM